MSNNPLDMFNTDNSNILEEHQKDYDNQQRIKQENIELKSKLTNSKKTPKAKKPQGRPLLGKEPLNHRIGVSFSEKEMIKIKAKIAKEKPYCSLSTHIREILKEVGEI